MSLSHGVVVKVVPRRDFYCSGAELAINISITDNGDISIAQW